MRNKKYLAIICIFAILCMVSSGAVCQEKTQPVEQKGLIFRLIDAMKKKFAKQPVAATEKKQEATAGKKLEEPILLPEVQNAMAAVKAEKIESQAIGVPTEPQEAAQVKAPFQAAGSTAASALPAEAEKAHAEMVAKEQNRRKTMTKEDLVKDIEETLDGEDEILGFIPELKKFEPEVSKPAYYTYKGTPLSDLDKEKLESISVRVDRTLTHITSQRVQEQLEMIRQINNLQRMQNIRATPPYVPPVVTQPPQQPPRSSTQPPPQPPRLPPSPPPQPPDTTRR